MAVITTLTSPVLIGDPVRTTGASTDSEPTLTQVNGVNIDVQLELKDAGFMNGRGTTTERDALVAANGMQFYNTTSGTLDVYAESAWQHIFGNKGVQYAELTLSAANIAAMFANGVAVIAAPGANLAIIVHKMSYQQFFLTGAYTGGGNVYLNYGATGAGTNYATTSNGIPAAFVTGVAANSSIISVDGTINSTTGLVIGSVANTGVYITNSAGAFATGAGTARVKVWYSIVSTD